MRLSITLRRLAILGSYLLLMGCASTPKAPMAKLPSFKQTLSVKQVWRVRAGGGTDGHYLVLTPGHNKNRIFTASYRGAITAINTQTGKRIWQIDTASPLTSGTSANKQGLLFTGTGFGMLYASKQSDGSLAWKKSMPSEILAAPTVINQTVLVKTEDGELQALNARTGNVRWTYKQTTPSLILRGGSSAAVSRDVAVVGFSNGKLAALTLTHGQILWIRQVAEPKGASVMQRMVDIDATPVIEDGVVYAATYQGRIAAYHLHSGKLLWHHDLSSFTGLVVGSNRVYVTDAVGHVWAFDRRSGQVVWHQNQLYRRGLTAPALLNNVLVVADQEGYVHFISAEDGHFLARMRTGRSGVTARPLVIGKYVYLYTDDGHLVKYAL